MKAMVLERPRPVDDSPLAERELASSGPEEGEVRVKVHVCGVCRTDLHIVEGELAAPELPVVPGHQVVGTVDATGDGVERVARGDRVGIPWMNSTCGNCLYCRSGRENLCDEARFTGLHRKGGYAEYVTVPEQFVYSIPRGFPDEQAAPLLCAGIIGYRTLKRSRVEPGERLGLYGFGASAHVTIQVARHWGCDVYVFTRSEDHQKHARELGAGWVGTAQDDPGVLMDACLVFAPAGWLMVEALKRTRKGGTVASAGIHMTPIPEFPYRLIYGERSLTTAANATYEDGVELLNLAHEIPISTEVEPYPLNRANEALQDLKNSRFRGAAVLKVSPRS